MTVNRGTAPERVSVLVDFDAYVSGNVTTQRYSDSGLVLTDGTLYPIGLTVSSVTISQKAFDSVGMGGRVARTVANIVLANYEGELNTIMAQGSAIGRAAVIKTLPVNDDHSLDLGGGNLSAATTVFSGTVSSLQHASNGQAHLTLSDLSSRLDVPLQPAIFAGSGGLEGTADMAGRRKPVSLGWRYNVTPVHLGSINLGDGSLPTYMLNAETVQGISAVRIRGVTQTEVTGTAPTTGQWREWASDAVFQLGSSPDGQVTCDVEGDNQGSSYAATASAIIQRMLRYYGPAYASGDVNSTVFSNFATALPGEQGWGTEQDITLAAALDEVLPHFGLWLCGGRDGDWRLATFKYQASSGADTFAIGPADIVSLRPIPLPQRLMPKPYAIEIMSERNWTPRMTDIAGSVSAGDRAKLSGIGEISREVSSTVGTNQLPRPEWRMGGLYRDAADAVTRAQDLRNWFQRDLCAWEIVTDRYFGQVELGMIISVVGSATTSQNFSYPRYTAEDQREDQVIVGWEEDVFKRRLKMWTIGVDGQVP